MQNALSASFSLTRRLMFLLTAVCSIAFSANGAFLPPDSSSASFSADGRYFVFDTRQALLPGDTNGLTDVYRLDRQTGGLTLVSVNQDNTSSGNDDSYGPVISADGNVVAFSSFASNLAAPDSSGNLDVFVRDLTAGVTTLISVNQAGTGGGNELSFGPQLSADGRWVAFSSDATNLVALPDHNGDDEEFSATDVFVRERLTGVTTLVSVNQTGSASGNKPSGLHAISADGRVVVFESLASDLVPQTPGNDVEWPDVYARDLASGVTSLVSVNTTGTRSGNALSLDPAVSADGTIVTFTSRASDLTANDTNDREDVFVRNLALGTTELVSLTSGGPGGGNGDSGASQLSADGKVVVFTSNASNLVAGDNNSAQDIFVRDLTTDVTKLVTVNRAGTGSGNADSRFPALSANGEVVAFESQASDLTENPVDGAFNVFVRNLKTGVTRLASATSFNGFGIGNTTILYPNPLLSGDGSVLAFRSAHGLHNCDHFVIGFILFDVNAPPVGSFRESSGLVVMEAEHFHGSTTASGHTWEARTDRAGFVGESAMRALPNNGANLTANIAATSPVLNYQVEFATTGTYNFWVRGFGANGSDDSVHIGLDGQVVQALPYSQTGVWMWRAKQVVISSPGLHEINVWMREDGAYVDRILLTANLSFTPTGNGPVESARVQANSAPDVISFFPPGEDWPPDQVATVAVGESLSMLVNFEDDSFGLLTCVWVSDLGPIETQMVDGVGEGNAPPARIRTSISYTPTADDIGTRTITVTIFDPGGLCARVTFTVIVTGGFAESGGLVVMEAEHYDSTASGSGHEWLARTDRAGFVGDSAMQALPNTGANISANITTACPVLNYNVLFNTTGTYNFWIRGFGANGSDDSVHVGVDGQVLQTLPYSRTGAWMWRAKQVVISSPGLHAVNVWMREDGAYVDRVLLSANLSLVPTGAGPPESERSAPQGGEPPPNDPADLTVWPNQTSHANSDQWLADHHDNLRRMNPRLLVVNLSNEATREHLDQKLRNLFAAFAESSRYHGYEDPSAPAFLNYQLYKFVDLRDPGSTLGNSSKVPLKSTGPDVDHQQFYGEQFAQYYGVRAPENPAHFLTLGELIDRGYVHELWYFAEHRPDLAFAPRETVELKARYDEEFRRIGNEFVDCSNGSDPDQPWTGRSVRIAFINASRGIGCLLENMAHGIEITSSRNAIPYFSRYFKEFGGFDLDTRFGLPWSSVYSLPANQDVISYPDPATAIFTDGVTAVQVDNYVAYGGNAHFTPNGTHHYDLTNTAPVLSTIEDWRIGSGPGGADVVEPWTVDAFAPYYAVAPDCMGPWLVYWRQNFPGLDNLQMDDNGARMKNWWPFLFY